MAILIKVAVISRTVRTHVTWPDRKRLECSGVKRTKQSAIQKYHAVHPGAPTTSSRLTERAVVLSIQDYRALTAHKPDLQAYLLGGPKVESFELDRTSDTGREIEL
jgi:hypothetical protein